MVYVQRPRVWAPTEEPWADRLSRTDLRLALAFFVTGVVAVFVYQMPLLGQVVLGAPLFEEFFKLGLALLPCAALGIRAIAVRLPLGLASGAGFGLLEHFISYAAEPGEVLYGRIAFHALSTGLSVLVLHGLLGRASSRRLLLVSTLPSTFVHAANNTAAVELALATVTFGLDPTGSIGLVVAAGFVVLLAAAFVTWPLWMDGYRRLVEAHLLPRLGPPATPAPGRVTSSTSSRS